MRFISRGCCGPHALLMARGRADADRQCSRERPGGTGAESSNPKPPGESATALFSRIGH